MNIYELSGAIKELHALADSGELTDEDIADTIGDFSEDLISKLEGAVKVKEMLELKRESLKAHQSRINNLVASSSKNITRIDDLIRMAMDSLNKSKHSCDLFTITMRKPTKQIGDVDESKLDSKYFDVIPESRKLDKRLLLADAKIAPVDGVELKDSARGLIIK